MSKTKNGSLPMVRKPQAAAIPPTTEEIALRAYHIYLERGDAPGDALEDWTRAERELLQETLPHVRHLRPRLRHRLGQAPEMTRAVQVSPALAIPEPIPKTIQN